MPKRAALSDTDDDEVIIMDSPPPRPPAPPSPSSSSSSSPPPPAKARKAKGKVTAARTGRPSSSASSAAVAARPAAAAVAPRSKALPPAQARRLPPPQPTHAGRKHALLSTAGSSSRYAGGQSSDDNDDGGDGSEGEDEYSPRKPTATSSAARLARAPSSQASSSTSRKPTSSASGSARGGASGKGKAKAKPKAAVASASKPPPPPKPAPLPREKVKPGWKGYAVPQAGEELVPVVPTKGYLSGIETLWSQGMFNPFQDGEPLKKFLRSGRQVRNGNARWGEDEPEQNDNESHSTDAADGSLQGTPAHQPATSSTTLSAALAPAVDEDVQMYDGDDLAQSSALEQVDKEDDDRPDGMSYEPAQVPPSPPPPSPPLLPLAAFPPPPAAPSSAARPVIKPPQNFRKISSTPTAAILAPHVVGSSRAEATGGRLILPVNAPGVGEQASPFVVPSPSMPRALSPPIPNERKRSAEASAPAVPLKKLRTTLPPPPGASPRVTRTSAASAGQDGQDDASPAPAPDADDHDDDVGDLSFYPQIQVDFDAAPAASDELASHRELQSTDLVHLARTKALVLAQLSGHAPPLEAAGQGMDAEADENAESLRSLTELLRGTAERGEGNSCLIQGVRGSGKTTVLHRALVQLEASTVEGYEPPHVIRLSALVQKDDKAAIREIGRQFGVQDQEEAAEEKKEGEEAESSLAPTTLPAHLLAILTAPSKKAIVIVLDEFDVFAGFGRGGRQMLLYCLLDVVQSIRPSMDGQSGRGVAVVGVTSRLDTLQLLEKRVKSRFSHRIIRIVSPFHGNRADAVAPPSKPSAPTATNFASAADAANTPGEHEKASVDELPKWLLLVSRALVPWQMWDEAGPNGEGDWRGAWRESIEHLLNNATIQTGLERLTWLTTDVRALLRVFVLPVMRLTPEQPFLTPANIQRSLTEQAQGAGWGKDMRKFQTLSLPCLSVLAAVKDLGERGILEFNFEHVFFTYGEFAKARLVGTGKARFGRLVMKDAFNQLAQTAILFPTQSATSATSQSFSTSAADFAKHRCAVSPYDIVELFRGPAGKGVMSQLSSWGRKYDI